MDVETAGAVIAEDMADGDESNTPALFVTSMPRDLWANPSLGALAALIDEAHHEENNGADQGDKQKAETVDGRNSPDIDMSEDKSDSKQSTLLQRDSSGDCAFKHEELCYEAVENPSEVRSTSSEGGSIRSTVAGRIRRDDVQRKRNDRRASPYGYSDAARRGSMPDRGCEDGRGLTKAGPTAGEAQVLMSLWGL